jgi:alkylhydroperoxidase family enzyme
MTRNIKVPRELMVSLKESLGEQALVELVGVISGYNMVSRFLVALEITPPDL